MYDNTFIDAWGHPQMIQKWREGVNLAPTDTPNINFAVELLYTMSNITKLVDTAWYVPTFCTHQLDCSSTNGPHFSL